MIFCLFQIKWMRYCTRSMYSNLCALLISGNSSGSCDSYWSRLRPRGEWLRLQTKTRCSWTAASIGSPAISALNLQSLKKQLQMNPWTFVSNVEDKCLSINKKETVFIWSLHFIFHLKTNIRSLAQQWLLNENRNIFKREAKIITSIHKQM